MIDYFIRLVQIKIIIKNFKHPHLQNTWVRYTSTREISTNFMITILILETVLFLSFVKLSFILIIWIADEISVELIFIIEKKFSYDISINFKLNYQGAVWNENKRYKNHIHDNFSYGKIDLLNQQSTKQR